MYSEIMKSNIYLVPSGGFGNRTLMVWEQAYQINKLNDFKFNIVMFESGFPEILYLDYPHTIQGSSKTDKIIDGIKKRFEPEIEEIVKPLRNYPKVPPSSLNYEESLKEIEVQMELAEKRISFGYNHGIPEEDLITKDNYKNLEDKHWYLTTSFYIEDSHMFIDEWEMERPIEHIRMKDRKLFLEIKENVKGCVGVHIRRGDVGGDSLKPGHEHYGKQEYASEEYYTEICDKFITKNPNQKFYVSTDARTFEEVKFFYDRYNVINEYSYVPGVDYYTAHWPFEIQEVRDLFSLVYSGYFVGCHSTWTDFVINFRNRIGKKGHSWTIRGIEPHSYSQLKKI